MPCNEVTALLEAHLHHIAERIGALQKLRRQILAISQVRSGGRCVGDRGALDALWHANLRQRPKALQGAPIGPLFRELGVAWRSQAWAS